MRRRKDMKKFLQMAAILMIAASTLTACTWTKQDTGTLAGGVVGAAAGNVLTGGSAVGTGIGAVGGAVVGNQLSR
jgi:osmotically inducible lipoprotein OsmB